MVRTYMVGEGEPPAITSKLLCITCFNVRATTTGTLTFDPVRNRWCWSRKPLGGWSPQEEV